MAKVKEPGFLRNYAQIVPDGRHERLTDLSEAFIQDSYKRYGALLFRGFPLTLDDLRTMTDRFCTHAIFNDSLGRKTVDDARAIQTVNVGEGNLLQHPELSREPWKPDVCWFGCFTPPKSGGETTICDGTTVMRKMPDSLRSHFEGRRLLYRKRASSGELEYWLDTLEPTDAELANPPADSAFTFDRGENGLIYRSFSRPAVHKPMFSEQPCWGNFLAFARHHNDSKRYPLLDDGSHIPDSIVTPLSRLIEGNRRPVKWREGDLLMVDNTRFTHGRNRVRDVGHRDIFTYFGFLNFAIPDPEEGANPRWRNPKIWRDVPTVVAAQSFREAA